MRRKTAAAMSRLAPLLPWRELAASTNGDGVVISVRPLVATHVAPTGTHPKTTRDCCMAVAACAAPTLAESAPLRSMTSALRMLRVQRSRLTSLLQRDHSRGRGTPLASASATAPRTIATASQPRRQLHLEPRPAELLGRNHVER